MSANSINWKIGVEIELTAPPGKSRLDLAAAIAAEHSGTVRRFFHPQVEPSKVTGNPVFHNVTPGFAVLDAEGRLIAQCVDDLTLQADFDKTSPPKKGWYRIVSDDARLVQLIVQQCDAADPLEHVLRPIAVLFGSRLEISPAGMIRVADHSGAPIAIAAPLPGERERPCELILPPIESDHAARIESILRIARELGFGIPREGATHIHFDARPLESAAAIAALSRILWQSSDDLLEFVQTNPHCRRLGNWPLDFYTWLQSVEFSRLEWSAALESCQRFEISKYCNFNLKNMLNQNTDKYTFEVRILPVYLHGQDVALAAAFFAAILRLAMANPVGSDAPADFNQLLGQLGLPPGSRTLKGSDN
ncbi:MAG: amidoligase family protein [Leptospiraceae bacterium]|nr:amidoligase family protein [Leptospiraceae bacterium]